MNYIVHEAYHFPSQEWKEQFASIDWSQVENSHSSSSISLSSILLSTINFTLTDNDKEILLSNYTSSSSSSPSLASSFLWKKFLLDFFIKFASLELEEEQTQQSSSSLSSSSSSSSVSKRKSSTNTNTLWCRVQKKLSTIQAMNAFKATGAEIARHRALSLLLEAIGKLHYSRFGGTLSQNLNFAASINRTEFKKSALSPPLSCPVLTLTIP
jgi:hypothetical protein